MVFRALIEADLALLHAWLNRPHVMEWWKDAPTAEEMREHFFPPPGSSDLRPYLAFQGEQSIGYIQSYVAVESEGGWWQGNTDPTVLGIDQFLADSARLGQGLGTAMVSRFVTQLFRDPAVSRIQVDPHPDNARAIRCYEKSGFHRAANITTPDGPALLMIVNRPPTPRTG